MILKTINYLNIFLMIAACLVAYLLPFETVLFSYAFLGPLHYLTQISWMHDRQYFSQNRKFVIVSMSLIVFIFFLGVVPAVAMIILAFGCASYALLGKKWVTIAGTMVCLIASHYVGWDHRSLIVLLLVPTVIHIYVFTGSFILVGLLNNKDFSSFLSFAYTYHYLNWFSKTSVIGWHRITRKRLATIVCVYAFAVGLYILDYALGFAALLFLSLLHVLLELPLNILTFKKIGSTVRLRKT